jgi:cation diffusion facilitator CzcD-associated flavoprotein CzcO
LVPESQVRQDNSPLVWFLWRGLTLSSGINFAYRIQERCPNLTYTILEGRDAIGGTWDLFKYPGIRSDSDLYTFGFPWNPWEAHQSIAEGPLIVKYVNDSAAKYGIDKKIQFGSMVDAANWRSDEEAWFLDVTSKQGQKKKFRGKFLLFCTGYYVRDFLSHLPDDLANNI